LAVLALVAGILAPVATMAAGLRTVPEEQAWITNGPVRATVATPGAVYLGGQFTHVGPRTGCGVPLDATTGAPVATYPRVDCGAAGSVNASISDGSGGWFIGGDFFQVDGLPISGIAHIKADGTVDDTWTVDMNYGPYAMALSPDGATLYLGGPFTQVEGESRVGLAAVNAATGALLPWNPASDGEVYALAISGDGATVYAGGYFSQAGGQASQNLVAIDAATGAGTAMVASPDESVNALALSADGLTLYVGGDFNLLAGAFPLPGMARVSTATGMPDWAWDPNVAGSVSAMILDEANGLIYMGGSFSSVGGTVRNKIAAVSLATGDPTAWDPDAGSGYVYALDLSVDGATIYAGGSFSMMGGEIRTRLAAIDTTTGALTAWNPIASNTVSAIAVAGGTVYVGGGFQSIGGCLRNSLAAIDPVTGRAMAFNPGPANPGGTDVIYVLAIAPDHQTLYVGGNFNSAGGQARNYLAALDATTGLATAWDPNIGGRVRALAISSDGQTLYLGGEFNTVGEVAHDFLAAVDTVTGLPAAWDADANDVVLALAISHDGTKLFAGGWFTLIGGQSRLGVALIDPATGLADPTWQADTELGIGGGGIYSLAITADDATLYAGGIFEGIDGVSRDDLAALNGQTAEVLPWNPLADDQVSAMVLSDDDATLYVGGQFSSIGGADRDYLAALDTTLGTALPWDPQPDSSVEALALGPGGASLFVVGYFQRWGTDFRLGQGFAQFNDPDLVANLILAVTPPGTGSTSPAAGAYEVATDVPIPIAATAAAGQLFIEWTVVGPGLVADADAASTTVTLTAPAAVTIVANFAPTAPLTLEVIPVDTGTTLPAAGVHTVVVGVPQAVSATPITGWHFNQWSLDAGNADIADTMTAATTITVTDAGGATITANFSKNQYTVTFQTDGTPGAGIAGTLVQVVDHGCDAGTVTAQSPVGYAFLHWTLDGVAYSAGAALQVMGVTRNMTLVAKFAAEGDAATLNLAAEGGGSTQPVPGALLVEVNQGVGVVAVPDPGYEFFGWEVTAGNAVLGDSLSTATTVTVTDATGATVTARFGQRAVLTIAADPDEGGTIGAGKGDPRRGDSLADAMVITVVVGQGVDISATGNFGFGFLGWTVENGDAVFGNSAVADTVVTVTTVAGATVVANFAEFDRLAVGSVFEIAAADVGLIGDFTLKPKVYGQYDHPVIAGKLGLKAAAKVLTKVDKAGTDPLDGEWTKKIKLYDAKAFKADQKMGVSARGWVPANQQDLLMALHVAGKEIPLEDQVLRNVILAAPEILTATVGAATITFEGNGFGTKKPKAWREYEVDDGAGGTIVKRQAMKVLKPTEADALAGFVDSKGKPAYMNAVTGRSKAVVELPAKLPKGTLNGVIVIDNGVGMGTATLP
jgi:hypothetical protein